MHNHSHCEHILKWCGICDIVYCSLCGREWGSKNWITTYNTPYSPISIYSTTTHNHKELINDTINPSTS